MEISDIRIKLIQDSNDRLKAVCSITLDDEFVVRDLKVVEGTNGLFVAMPSRKLSVHCPQCRGKNHLRARFCNECGAKLPPARATGDAAGRLRMHRDIAHPINPTFREIVQSRVIEKYRAEAELAKNPDYSPVDIDADYEEKVVETQEDTSANYAPSEYDQLIAGLNKGATAEPARERETRAIPPAPVPKPTRPNDRHRSERDDRPARPAPARNASPRQTPRAESRRPEPSRPPRNQGSKVRSAQSPPDAAQSDDGGLDEVNGNIAVPDSLVPPAVARRPSSPPSRRMDERPISRRGEQRPASRDANESSVEHRNEESTTRAVEPPRPKPPTPVQTTPRPKPAKLEDLPFGAGL